MSIKDSGGFSVTRSPYLDVRGRKAYIVEILISPGQWLRLTYSEADLQEIRRIIGKALREDQ